MLDLLTEVFDMRLVETSHTKGIATFCSSNGSVCITYQRSYESDWSDSKGPLYDKPDIVIEFNNLITFILDARIVSLLQLSPILIEDKWMTI